jgi:hypothetical protein
MTAAALKRKLKNTTGLPEELGIRLHRSISWMQCAEDNVKDWCLKNRIQIQT